MISALIAIVIAGVLLYLFNTLVPMDARFKTVVNALVCLLLFLYILQVFGVWHGGSKLLS